MASQTASVKAPASKLSYFKLETNNNENGGYSSSFVNNGQGFVGQKSTSGTGAGANVTCFAVPLVELPNPGKISSITFSTYTTNSTSGYNNCVAKLEYVGESASNYPALWRVGTDTDTWPLNEKKTTTMTVTDTTTCNNFKSLIMNSDDGSYYWFRLVRVSGQGAWLKSDVTITITYEEGSTAYVWNGSEWRAATPYVWDGSSWALSTPSIYDGEWK